MNYEVTLKKDDQIETIIVSQVELLSDTSILKTFDPSQCPESMEDDIVFVSSRLSAMILEDSDVKIIKAEPTDEAVPMPEPTF